MTVSFSSLNAIILSNSYLLIKIFIQNEKILIRIIRVRLFEFIYDGDFPAHYFFFVCHEAGFFFSEIRHVNWSLLVYFLSIKRTILRIN